MSVLARLRGKSQLDVLQLAEEIRAEATRLVWNTNVVPKGCVIIKLEVNVE